MMAIGVAGRSTLLGPVLRAATGRSLIAPGAIFSIPNPSSRLNTSSLCQARTEVSASRFLRRELSTHQPFYSAIASACLVSKLSSDVTASYEGSHRENCARALPIRSTRTNAIGEAQTVRSLRTVNHITRPRHLRHRRSSSEHLIQIMWRRGRNSSHASDKWEIKRKENA